jgi:YidC/Oxa1 family membrane protein insertase
MQDQAKRLLLAVGLALLVMVAWNRFFSPEPPPKPTPAAETANSAVSSDGVAPAAVQRSRVGTLVGGSSPAAFAEQSEKKIHLTFKNVTATFSDRDAALVSWRLADSKYLHDPSLGEVIAQGRGLLLANFAQSTFVVPAGASWNGEQLSETQVRYTFRTDNLEVVKVFTIYPKSFLVMLSVQVKATADAQQQLAITSYGYQDPRVDPSESREHPRVFMSATLAGGEISSTPLKSIASAPRAVSDVRWTGFDHPYLLIAMAPNPKVPHVEKFTSATGAPGGIQTDLLFPRTILRANDPPITQEVVTYIGPKNYEELEGADKVAGFSTGFKETVDLGWFKIIGRPLLSLLTFLFGLVGNWGIAIVLLTVLVKAATLYWTTKSMRSMKAMAVLGPKMKELQAKYGADRAKLQQETMALYKHNGVNPLAGCLPIFLQMPIWIALYRMLSSASELYLQPFIGGWIEDLTSRDPFYVLPVVVTATMFLQSKLQPATGDNMQQKIMMYGMPLMFGAMGLFFPAGLTLYMFTNTVLGALHSVYMNKFDKPSLAMAAKHAKPADLEKSNKAGDGKKTETGTAASGSGAAGARADGDDHDDEPKGSSHAKESVASRSNSKRKRRR